MEMSNKINQFLYFFLWDVTRTKEEMWKLLLEDMWKWPLELSHTIDAIKSIVFILVVS